MAINLRRRADSEPEIEMVPFGLMFKKEETQARGASGHIVLVNRIEEYHLNCSGFYAYPGSGGNLVKQDYPEQHSREVRATIGNA
jgi:hypothetical protein